MIDVRQLNSPAQMLLQVHDELIFECPEELVDVEMKKIKERMESAYTLKVPLLVSIRAGLNWEESH